MTAGRRLRDGDYGTVSGDGDYRTASVGRCLGTVTTGRHLRDGDCGMVSGDAVCGASLDLLMERIRQKTALLRYTKSSWLQHGQKAFKQSIFTLKSATENQVQVWASCSRHLTVQAWQKVAWELPSPWEPWQIV